MMAVTADTVARQTIRQRIALALLRQERRALERRIDHERWDPVLSRRLDALTQAVEALHDAG